MSRTSGAQFRLPTHLTNSDTPTSARFDNQLCHGQWYLLRTSNQYWKDKLNIRTECLPTGSDCFFYQFKPGGTVKTMKWNTKAVEGETATFASQGTGLLRLIGAKWEVIGWSNPAGLDSERTPGGPAWQVGYQHGTLLTSAAINVSCREPGGISEEDWTAIGNWLAGIEDAGFRKAVEEIFTVTHE
ncbi:hypothetical protein PMIN03_002408 [Paraphaeosphaeria minitans]|uniref:Uncharacterized protein n=1 Tax=Paraphaeosphaeria minitans TaxID=565426 RepID=A0A9P6GGA1_9PLEO|nr:hypothetical protein PMIN01_07696 [Paraphaeosphaeria minitans]